MTDWAAFAGFAGVVLGLLLLLAHASQSVFSEHSPDERQPTTAEFNPEHPLKRRYSPGEATETTETTTTETTETTADGGVDASGYGTTVDDDHWEALDVGNVAEAAHANRPAQPRAGHDMSTASLLVNVAFSQGLFGTLLVVGAWYTEIPLSALGLAAGHVGLVPLLLGVGLGVGLYAVNEVGAALGERVGIASSEELREALAPDSAAGWAVLLLLVLPVIAGFEELLFRAALVGVFSAGFGVSPWLLAALSSVAFALGHGAQGPGGIVVTGLLGFVLAAAFVLTGSLFVVIVAHYLVNALEFVVHEGLGVDWV